MRFALVVILLILGPAAPGLAMDMVATTYDDGRSCPEGCDAHVVFKKSSHNGTANAFAPGPSGDLLKPRRTGKFAACEEGQACMICFGDKDESCMLALFRGNGPKPGRFDFTPRFMIENCAKSGLPKVFADQCKSHVAKAEKLKQKLNCFAEPAHPMCKEMMAAAVTAREADEAKYFECKKLGQAAYNKKQSDKREIREHDCAYFKNVAACTEAKPCGIRLAPGACGAGYLVGRSGLDCCSGVPEQAAIDTHECGGFYLDR